MTDIGLKVKRTYEIMLDDIINHPFYFNDKDFRLAIVERLKSEVKSEIIVICNEENNPSSIIDQNALVAKVLWKEDGYDFYTNLIFGSPETIEKLQKEI